jgi:hypothetical protein
MVYLLHFDRGFKHARHFVGATTNADEARALARGEVPRIDNPMLNAARLAGVRFSVERIWSGGHAEALNRRIAGNHAKICPACATERREARA